MPERATPKKSASKATAKPGGASSSSKPGPDQDKEAARQEAPTAVQPVEPEDAYLTGVSRSLQRRLLGLNVDGAQGQAKPHPEATEAGLHSTGSRTKTAGGPVKDPKAAKKK